ncbi:MAG: sigma-70 family RNA polymerase sigma factor [Deltaproteobacteria bacterium]|nr:MAG: sigma-70 family RNA polymerase sigma factor [Deltaproteobacteria bacterium]
MSYAFAQGLPAAAGADRRPVTADSDTDLVERANRGDRGAFEELVRRYQRPLFYLALRYVKNEADAADVVQRAFVRAFRGLRRFRGEASVRTWLYRIAINLSLNHVRDRRREQPADIDAAALRTEAVGSARLERRERARRLRAAIAQLPPKQRAVVELRIYDELPFRDIAAVVGGTENAAKVNFHYGMRRLRALVQAQEDVP